MSKSEIERRERGTWSCGTHETQTAWLDVNGHVNVRYYLHLVGCAVEKLFGTILGAGAEPEPVIRALETRTFYKSELRAGRPIALNVRPLERDADSLRVLVRILERDGSKRLSAECEWRGGILDPPTGGLRGLGVDARKKFDTKLAQAARLDPYETPVYRTTLEIEPPAPAERPVTFRSRVLPDWTAASGRMEIEYYTLIFDLAADRFYELLGFDTPAMRRGGWGMFAVGTHVRYMEPLRKGESIEVRTTLAALGRKSVSIRHRVFRLGDERAECAVCDHTSVFVDWKTRRSIALPEAFRAKVADLHGIDPPPTEA